MIDAPAPPRSPTPASSRLSLALCLLIALATLLPGCGARHSPNLERIFAEAKTRAGKRPVIFIPGILGSQLVNDETGEVVWPSAFRSSVDGLTLPVTPNLAANRDKLVARKIVETAKFARLTPEVYVYHEVLKALHTYGGYVEHDWDEPGVDGDHDALYVFPYDWRRDNVETARELIKRIEILKRRLHRPELRFNIVAHSMGGLIARYAARYGDADLPSEGIAPVPTWAGATAINKIIMFGTPNEGAADAFATLLNGYSITAGLRRRIPLFNKLSREGVLTAPSIFQLLPHVMAVRFLDENLQPVAIDLYDPATWRHYGWSPVADPDYRRRFVSGRTRADDAPFHGGSLADLDGYFAAALHRAKRFHEALDAPEENSPVLLFAFGGDCEETLDAPVILRDEKKGGWMTLTSPREFRTPAGRRFSRQEVTLAMYAPGDGRVTRRSLLAETLAAQHRGNSLFDTALPIAYAVFGCDLHGDLQNNKTLQDNALTALVSESLK